MNNFMNFTNETLGTIRTLENNGTTWFVAKDVCSIITSVPVASVLKRVSEDNKDRLNLGLGGNYTNVVNEDGLLQILDGGQTEKARILKQWIVSEVLPYLQEKEENIIVEEEIVNDEETIPFDEVTVDSTPTSDSCVSNDESKNNFTIFSNAEFGDVRTIMINDKPYFCASDIAKALGYSNPRKAVLDHCKGVTKRDTPTSGGIQSISYINEGDVYRLIIKSKLPSAEKFESWVMDEVLPTLEEETDITIEDKETVPFEETSIPFDEVDGCFTPAIYEEPSIVEDEIDLTIIKGQIMVSSLEVAEKFNKRHTHVLDIIKGFHNDLSTAEFSALFILSSYIASNGKKNYKYLMNRDGFSLLCMGFTGKKALDWKLKYINAFNQMEERLKTSNTLSEEEKLKLQLFSSDPSEVAYAHAQLLKLATAPLEKEICEQKVLIEEQKPLVTFATHVTKTSDTVDMGEFAKIVAKEKINVGRNRLFTWLRDQGYLMANNVPYQRYINNGYFKVIEVSKVTSYGKINVFPKTLVTGKGQIYLVERLREEFGMVA